MKTDPEYYIVASCINDAYALHESLNRLTPEDFENFDAQEIFEACRQLAELNTLVDPAKIAHTLEKRGTLAKIGGVAFISSVAFIGGSEIDTDFYIKEILSKSLSRKLVSLSDEAIRKAQKDDDPNQLIEEMITKLTDMQIKGSSGFRPMEDVYDNFKDGLSFPDYFTLQCEKASSGVDVFDGFRTGYHKLDTIIGGFERGTNNIIGASTSAGKTTFFVNLFLNIRQRYPKAKMGFFSFEMPSERIYTKILTTFAGIPIDRTIDFRCTDEERERIIEASKMLSDMNIYIDDVTGHINTIKAKTRAAVIRDGIDIIFVDYLSRVQGDKRANKHLEVDQISKGLQDIALELKIPVVTLAQLNRNAGHRERPVLADLRESGSIEEDADLVLLLNRPNRMKENDFTEVQVAKNRIRGNLGIVQFSYDSGRLFEMETVQDTIKSVYDKWG